MLSTAVEASQAVTERVCDRGDHCRSWELSRVTTPAAAHFRERRGVERREIRFGSYGDSWCEDFAGGDYWEAVRMSLLLAATCRDRLGYRSGYNWRMYTRFGLRLSR